MNYSNNVSGSKNILIPVAIIAGVLVLAIGGLFVYRQVKATATASNVLGANNTVANSSPSQYWSVSLNNGETYFGKLNPNDLNGNYINLSEVYYLVKSTDNTAAAPAAKGATAPAAAAATPGYTLVHLGNEVHGPADKMMINKDNVLYVEQLRADSKVVTAITGGK
ncbi:MAG: hypothetical protein NT141_03225 [candidate division WWE3 bacterium]|nr:hypothetical protein [candidate division WWE3 bacterium]